MPRIADHCRPGGWRGRTEPHNLVCAWPDDVFVQWGGHGLVVSRGNGGKSYTTAFFEAFPGGGGFIRGEGDDVAAAERAAFAQFERERACAHVWGRRGYLNSGGVCLKCKAFMSGKFAAHVHLGGWRRPLTRIENDMLRFYERNGHSADPNRERYARKLRLRKAVFGADEAPATIGDHIDLLSGGKVGV